MPKITAEYLASQGLSEDFPKRFWSKINKNGPVPKHCPELGNCWIWTASTCRGDYGHLSSGIGGKLAKTHRSSWIIHFGPIPEGMCVLHKCDVGRCVRPDHLWLGTQPDNIKDMVKKGRQRSGDHNGTKHGMHILTNEQVRKIRCLYQEERFNQRQLARIFGVCFQTINMLILRKTWKHI